MKIETKFDIKDEVFYIKDKNVVKSVITGIRTLSREDRIYIKYCVWNDEEYCEEKDLYKTKEDLIKSL